MRQYRYEDDDLGVFCGVRQKTTREFSGRGEGAGQVSVPLLFLVSSPVTAHGGVLVCERGHATAGICFFSHQDFFSSQKGAGS